MDRLARVLMLGSCGGSVLLAVTALFLPSWVEYSFAGTKQLGLLRSCRQPLGMPEWCGIMTNAPIEWTVTAFLILAGAALLLMAVACALVAEIRKEQKFLVWTKGFAGFGVIFLCLASLTFPIGFSLEEVGGSPYKLPHLMKVGTSFSCFMTSVFLAIVTNIVASQVVARRNFR